MKNLSFSLLIATGVIQCLVLTSCSQEDRTAQLIDRQNRIDERTQARQERWKIRAEREDARADAFFDSM